MTTSAKSDKIVKIVIGLLPTLSYGVTFALTIYVMYTQGRGLATNTAAMSVSILGSVLVASLLALVFVFKIPFHAAGRAKYAASIGRTATINTKALFFSLGIPGHVLRVAFVITFLAIYLLWRGRTDATLRAQSSFYEAVSSLLGGLAYLGTATLAIFVRRKSWIAAGYTKPSILAGLSFLSAAFFFAFFTTIAIWFRNRLSTLVANSHSLISLMNRRTVGTVASIA